MAPPQLGKRKRVTREELEQASRSPTPVSDAQSQSQSEDSSDGEDAEVDVQELFRRAFEAKFKPLEGEVKKRKVEKAKKDVKEQEKAEEWGGIGDKGETNTFDDRDDEDEESDMEGEDSEDEDEEEDSAGDIEVVDYTNTQYKREKLSKAELKAFMSSKPPSSTPKIALPTPSSKSKDDDPAEANHLTNDLALQKLLRDSHLLNKSMNFNASSASTKEAATSITATGALRHKSTDLAIMALGAKKSIHAQKSMPMSHRKGINEAGRKREEKRRAEAKEAGIVLEKEAKKRKFTGERERGLGGPSVGKFKGGVLKLSKSDVRDINNSGERGFGGGRGGRGGRGGKGKRGRR